MAQKKPKFEIGDILVQTVNNDTTIGVVFDCDENIVKFQPFHGRGTWHFGNSYRFLKSLEYCEGMINKECCENCEYKDLCRVLPDIVKCDVSEFAEYMGKGKYDIDICRQRQCKHVFFCHTRSLIRGHM